MNNKQKIITGYPPGTVKLPTRSFYLPPVAAVPALRDLGMHSGFSFARAMGVRQMIKYNYDPNLATAYTIWPRPTAMAPSSTPSS